jgi:Arc/MetJ-type ribon-helix-helix transcriptional regulator
MMHGMTKSKVAVSLPSELVDRARRAVKERRAASVSAYVADALEEKVKLDDLAAMLDAMLEETGGPMTRAERRAADRALGLTRKRQARTRVA